MSQSYVLGLEISYDTFLVRHLIVMERFLQIELFVRLAKLLTQRINE